MYYRFEAELTVHELCNLGNISFSTIPIAPIQEITTRSLALVSSCYTSQVLITWPSEVYNSLISCSMRVCLWL